MASRKPTSKSLIEQAENDVKKAIKEIGLLLGNKRAKKEDLIDGLGKINKILGDIPDFDDICGEDKDS